MSTVERAVAALLIILAVGGVVVSELGKFETAFRYWLWMVPLFGVLSLIAAGMRASRQGEEVGMALLRQVLHWSALGAAVYLLFYLQQIQRLEPRDVSLLALLALGLTTFLAGVHGDWHFCVIGLILGVGAAVMALLDAYRLLVLIPIALVALVLVVRRRREPAVAPTAAAPVDLSD